VVDLTTQTNRRFSTRKSPVTTVTTGNLGYRAEDANERAARSWDPELRRVDEDEDDDYYRKGVGDVPKTCVIRAALSKSTVSLNDLFVWTQDCATGQQE
jgi:hypothetical protein